MLHRKLSILIALTLYVASFILTVSHEAFGCSAGLPAYNKLIDECNTIVLGTFEGPSSDYFLVHKILKCPESLGNRLLIYSNSSLVFNGNDIRSKSKGRHIILLGNWVSPFQVIVPWCDQFSFWPYGPRQDYLPTRSLSALEKHIIARLKEHSPTPTPTPNPAEYNSDSVRKVEKFIQEHQSIEKTPL